MLGESDENINEAVVKEEEIRETLKKEVSSSTTKSPLSTSLGNWRTTLKMVQKNHEEKLDSSSITSDLQVLSDMEIGVTQTLINCSNNSNGESEKVIDELKKFNRQLLRVIAELKQKNDESLSPIAQKLVDDKVKISEILKTKEGIEKLILHLYQQVKLLKQQILQESKRRNELEILMEVEINELNKLLLAESQARYDLRFQLEQAMSVKNSILGDLKLLQGYLEVALAKDDENSISKDEQLAIEDTAIRQAVAPEIAKLMNITLDMDLKFSTILELAEFSNMDSLTEVNPQEKLLSKLTSQIEQEKSKRKEIEQSNLSIEEELKQLQKTLDEEREKRKQAELKAVRALQDYHPAI